MCLETTFRENLKAFQIIGEAMPKNVKDSSINGVLLIASFVELTKITNELKEITNVLYSINSKIDNDPNF